MNISKYFNVLNTNIITNLVREDKLHDNEAKANYKNQGTYGHLKRLSILLPISGGGDKNIDVVP